MYAKHANDEECGQASSYTRVSFRGFRSVIVKMRVDRFASRVHKGPVSFEYEPTSRGELGR